MIKMKKTTLIISALLALNVSHNANSEPEKSTPAPAAETAPASTPVPADANSKTKLPAKWDEWVMLGCLA